MDDITANRIVFFILLLIILGIILSLHAIVGPTVYGSFVNQLKNNSGEFSSYHVLMMVSALIGLYLLLSFLNRPTSSIRSSTES